MYANKAADWVKRRSKLRLAPPSLSSSNAMGRVMIFDAYALMIASGKSFSSFRKLLQKKFLITWLVFTSQPTIVGIAVNGCWSHWRQKLFSFFCHCKPGYIRPSSVHLTAIIHPSH